VSDIANTLVDVYLAHRTERYEAEARRAYDVLTQNVEIADKDLKDSEARRLAFTQEEGIIFDFQKESLEVGKLTEQEQTLASSRAHIAGLEATLREIEKQIAGEPDTKMMARIYENNSVYEAAKLKRFEVEAALMDARNRYREDSPEIQELIQHIAGFDRIMSAASEKLEKGNTEGLNVVRQELLSKRNALTSELEGSRAAFAVMEESAAVLRVRLAAMPQLQTTLRALDRERGLMQEKYQQLLAKQAQAAVSLTTTRATMPSMRLVEYAGRPGSKTSPKTKILYPIALLAGLAAGIAAAVLVTYAGGRVRKEHLERGRRVAPLYGTIAVATRGRPFTVLTHQREHE
jgi:uncharacterized protein involved in exopolysaccharide biosynthesis